MKKRDKLAYTPVWLLIDLSYFKHNGCLSNPQNSRFIIISNSCSPEHIALS